MPLIRETDLIRSITKQSFYCFLQEFWPEISPEKPVWNWHIKFICDEVQTVLERVFRHEDKEYELLLNVPPGSTKSSICSVALPCWAWTRMPHLKFLGASYTDQLALDLSQKSRDVIRSEKYGDCFPEIIVRSDQDTKALFMNVDKGARYAVGVRSSVIGMHFHIHVIDDAIDPKNVVYDAVRKEVNDWIKTQLSQRKVDKGVTPLIMIQQRLHQDDPSANLLLRAKPPNPISVRHICLPDRLSPLVSPPEARVYYSKDGLLDPVRFSEAKLKQAEKELGEFGYAGQFSQNPVPAGGGMFKVDKLIANTRFTAPDPKEFEMVVRYWDKAASLSRDAAWTVGVKMARDKNKQYWVLHVIRDRWNTAAREKVIEAMARQDGKGVIIGLEQEPGSGGLESVENTTKRLAGYRVRINKPTGGQSKEIRADEFSVQVNQGNVYLLQGAWNEEYLEELRFFPVSKYKDQIDSSSGCFSILNKKKVRVGVFGKV